ncbi:MAG TPA: SdpI family protein [Dinghuibacter sp.]|jgi:uncharacterized membrane protein|uniref:SdpI family protein n=1 Tax=Dinghuibacter sp. TaxID=2024697 RepID=UPI002BF476DA|nr:SdpI family protein [Dinghuibacter sp.]HTJ12506.1 SdpI family protein [Dinghuibacter sp.]
MTAKFTWGDLVAALVWLAPLAYLAYVYPQLPATVPTHFDLRGEANAWGTRGDAIVGNMVLMGVSLGVALLLRYLPSIDPKKKIKYSMGTLRKITYAIVFLFTVLNVAIIYSTQHGRFVLGGRLLYVLMSLFYVYLGNLFYSLKPNYFVGIRTAWTLENETVWRKTHQWGGRLWVVQGLVMAAACALLPENAGTIVFFIGTGLLGLGPVVYSYLCYRRIQKA